jgi:transposase
MLFDTTSVSYWGEGEYSPNLLKFGHSKEKRSDLKQLIVGLLMTGAGIPVGHEVFSGNQVDVRSFPQIITKVKDKFGLLSRIVWVCDRGMISESNISLLESIKHEYVIGVRMRMLNAAQKQVLLVDKLKDFKKIYDNLYVKEVILDVEIEIPEEENKEGKENKQVNGDVKKNEDKSEDKNETNGKKKKKEKKTKIIKRRFIVCHNPEQADEDAIKRARFKEIITKKVLEKSDKKWIVKNGFKKYLKLKEDIIESIDYEKLEKEKIYDGKWVLLTNTELEYTEIAKYYKSLWQIESAFRELKSSLDVKPMYHWVERRIRGHIFICFLALVMELCFKNKLGEKVSYIDVMHDLKKLQATLIKVKDKEVVKRNAPVGMANIAISQLKLKLPGINLL